MKTIYAIIAYLAAVVLRFAEGNDTSDSQNRGAFYPLTTDTASPEGSEAKHAFKRVLRAVYNQPYIVIPPKPSGACMGFCDVLTGIKKALASRQEMPQKLALSPIECQNLPYYLVDYRINGSEKLFWGMCPRWENQTKILTGVDFSQVRQNFLKKIEVCVPSGT